MRGKYAGLKNKSEINLQRDRTRAWTGEGRGAGAGMLRSERQARGSLAESNLVTCSHAQPPTSTRLGLLSSWLVEISGATTERDSQLMLRYAHVIPGSTTGRHPKLRQRMDRVEAFPLSLRRSNELDLGILLRSFTTPLGRAAFGHEGALVPCSTSSRLSTRIGRRVIAFRHTTCVLSPCT